ncbi:MAG: sugar phosphate isomerase/epimerase [Oscillospiraceae bacterium]|nr:sugar phosphate isomerase/epimerase [Oscillospiraceae bacterium]
MAALPPGWGKDEMAGTEAGLPLAAQLFVVAESLSKDLRGTLRKVKEAGYDAVEFAGALRFVARDVRYALDEAGLRIAGWHTPWEYLKPSNIHSTISYNETLGNQYVIVPWMPPELLATSEGCLRFAGELTWVSDVLGMHGMVTGYHNHAAEFKPTEDTGELPWDLIAQNTPSNVVMQNDVGNGMHGGGDMVGLLRKYPGRAPTVHMKPYSAAGGTFFGEPGDEVDWDDYFSICRRDAGVRWYIVEYLNKDRYPGDPIGALADSARWFRGRGGK